MKTIILTAVLLMSSISHAWEFRKNPDRFPSLGFNLSTSRLDGKRDWTDLPGTFLSRTQSDRGFLDMNSMGLDIRFPISNGVTLTFSYDRLEYESLLTRDQNIITVNDSFSGDRFGFSTRIYFNK